VSGVRRGDPLAGLLDLPGVAEDSDAAREAVDRLLAHRALRRSGGAVTAESALRGAWASAALQGAEHDLAAVRAGTVTDPVLQGALRVGGALPALAPTWERAPAQVLARLHVLASGGGHGEVGRPTAGALPAGAVAARLAGLAGLVAGGPGERSQAPAVVVAAVVQGELLAMVPFAGPNGVVARAAARLTLGTRGLDPPGVSVPEAGHLARRPEYVGAANAYATGTPDGVRSWLRHCCTAVRLGAEEGLAICDSVRA